MLGGLENVFYAEFWKEYYSFFQLTLQGTAPIDLFIAFTLMLLIAIIMLSSPIWLAVLIYKLR